MSKKIYSRDVLQRCQSAHLDLLNLFLSTSQMHLALYCFANGQLSTALRLLYRARYLMLVVSGEDHPEMALLDVSEFCFHCHLTHQTVHC